jgi:hypothetical protein
MFSNGMSTARVLLVIHHLNVRVAWHDNRWNGGICLQPSRNSFCLDLARIRKERDDDAEESLSGQAFADLAPSQLPPCIAESGGFMNDREWWRIAAHPYQEIKKTQVTHGHLKPTRIGIPPFSTFAVPFLSGCSEKARNKSMIR